ncbi:MAG: hypothetical protein ACP5DC_04960 [Halothiobacillaceae bacterium]
MNLPEILADPSGGLIYHWRALRYRKSRWEAFRAHVDRWLSGWYPDCENLLIVGPSAGYTLPEGLTTRFSTTTVLEPDPLARWLLRRQPEGRRMIFQEPVALDQPGGIQTLAQAFPEHAILFANLIGQLLPPGDAGWPEILADALADHHWASYHDVFSSHHAPNARAPRDREVGIAFDQCPEKNALLARFWAGHRVTVTDHDTFGLGGPEAPHQYALWPLTPRDWQLVEWTVHAPAQAE